MLVVVAAWDILQLRRETVVVQEGHWEDKRLLVQSEFVVVAVDDEIQHPLEEDTCRNEDSCCLQIHLVVVVAAAVV